MWPRSTDTTYECHKGTKQERCKAIGVRSPLIQARVPTRSHPQVAEPREEIMQAGWHMVSEATQTTCVCVPGGSHRGTVWQTPRGRAASTRHMSGMCIAGESRLGPPSTPVSVVALPLGPSTAGGDTTQCVAVHPTRHSRGLGLLVPR